MRIIRHLLAYPFLSLAQISLFIGMTINHGYRYTAYVTNAMQASATDEDFKKVREYIKNESYD